MKTAKEIYARDVRLLPHAERLRLVSMIIDDMASDSHLEHLSFDNRQRFYTDEAEPALSSPRAYQRAMADDLG